jgi:hypothetical protein
MRLYCIISLALALTSTLPAATYEVALQNPKASDDAPGTTDQPWKTLAKAAEKAAPGDTVLIRTGTYHEHLLLKTSGTAQAPIRFEAAPGEHVVITGADASPVGAKPRSSPFTALPGRTSSSPGTQP